MAFLDCLPMSLSQAHDVLVVAKWFTNELITPLTFLYFQVCTELDDCQFSNTAPESHSVAASQTLGRNGGSKSKSTAAEERARLLIKHIVRACASSLNALVRKSEPQPEMEQEKKKGWLSRIRDQ